MLVVKGELAVCGVYNVQNNAFHTLRAFQSLDSESVAVRRWKVERSNIYFSQKMVFSNTGVVCMK
jgi:hypothetical protein